MIAFLQENSVYSLKDGIGECEATVQIYVGEKEKQSMKKSAKIIHEKLQDSFIQVLPNMYHGEFSINHADDYVRKLLEIVNLMKNYTTYHIWKRYPDYLRKHFWKEHTF